jgi:hypothetical protein
MSATDSIRALQEVVQDLSEKGMVKEEAFRQISEATMSAFSASQEANPFTDPRLLRKDFRSVEMEDCSDSYLRHMPTGRIYVRDPEDDTLIFRGIIMNHDRLPVSLTNTEDVVSDNGIVCWVEGHDPRIDEILKRVGEMEEENREMKGKMDKLNEVRQKYEEKLKAAREGSLLAFQEVEIKDLEEERDRYKKLNEGLIKKLKEEKGASHQRGSQVRRHSDALTEDLFLAWEHMRDYDMPIPTTTEETAKFCRWWAEKNEELPECFSPVPFVWNGADYLLIEPTNEILDKEDGEVLGKRYMCGNCDEVHVKWNYESDSDDEGPDSP